MTENSISVSGAKQKFEPAELNTDRQNYADELRCVASPRVVSAGQWHVSRMDSPRRPKMLGAQHGNAPFELSGMGPSTRPPETKFQRFQRLQADVKALLDEINADGALASTHGACDDAG